MIGSEIKQQHQFDNAGEVAEINKRQGTQKESYLGVAKSGICLNLAVSERFWELIPVFLLIEDQETPIRSVKPPNGRISIF